jgi:hypothetical protein
MENHPELFEKAKEYEKIEAGNKITWNRDWTLSEIEVLNIRYDVKSADNIEACAVCHL